MLSAKKVQKHLFSYGPIQSENLDFKPCMVLDLDFKTNIGVVKLLTNYLCKNNIGLEGRGSSLGKNFSHPKLKLLSFASLFCIDTI